MTGPESARIDWSQGPEHAPIAGITGRVHLGRELSAARFQLAPGAAVPRHTHPNEEFGQVLAGTLELEVDGEQSRLVAGDAFLIPGDVPHAALAGPEGCLLLECYAPPRDPFAGPAGGAGA
jgi:quercetin dioxygenase-like cupin family protein